MAGAREVPVDKVLGGRYRLDEAIGQGGMATVFRARDEVLGRDVAVKLFHNSAVEAGRQEGELAVLSGLDHHALVQLHDAGLDTDDYGRSHRYLVMALVNGSDLHQRIKAGPLSARHIAEIGYDLAEALDYIHAHNVVHRDLKPSNVLLVDYGDGSTRARAKLTDFGVALAEDMERMTAEGATTGTAGYLSPEQASGRPVGPPTDVYSLGLVLLECFTQHLEFAGSVVESAMARLTRDPLIPENLPEHWQQLLAAMTARDPDARPMRHELVALLKMVVIAESGRHRDEELEPLFPEGVAGASGAAEGARTGAGARSALDTRPDVLDTLPDEALDRVTAMAARLFRAPISLISVVDHDRVWFKSHYEPDVERVARKLDLTMSSVPSAQIVVVEDARSDPRTSDHVLVTGPLGMRFYVGVPLKRGDGSVIGTLCVMHFLPGTATQAEIENLEDLAALVVSQLELRQVGLRTTTEIETALPVPARSAEAGTA
ncbi:serine/threonine protein kinase [Subtercola sp. Z020]|uniref:protein kinase domain-containing protein n=1 Tax=Subtercola sp. Z020 TaxID=2080582 RepID=UPI000CE746DC|nr:protein kinase [Subtercola sp. Z020]PPF79061.1 serine/threonine protein kinase [Subtercola sp. Z020]